VPADYVTINSGLGESQPLNIIVLPILFEGSVRAVIELASFSRFSATHQAFLDQLTESIGLVLNTIEANTLTENLLTQAQFQAQELQSRQEDLRSSNEDLAKQARRLAEQNIEVEAKNQEVEGAKQLLEEKAEQLAVSSAFKSEFFSNMSHELRTPLNSMLILAGELQANPDSNLTDAQLEYAATIHSSGTDLLKLLNDVLDLAKVESGTVTMEMGELALAALTDALEREFRPVADLKGMSFVLEIDATAQRTITTDSSRLRQVLKNLLSNAFKFSDRGEVRVRVSQPHRGWSAQNQKLARAESVIAFSITDSGIGIEDDLQTQIFEAFAQADGTSRRQYGGTGLGLSISREIVELLGGEITLQSTPGEGSTFTVYVPTTRSAEATPLEQLAPKEKPAEAAKPRRPAPDALVGMKVLVVDDDFRNIFSMTALLERGGMEVIPAESGAEALAVLHDTADIGLVLVDIMMPVMDGYETMREMRKLSRDSPLAIVAVTAKLGTGERERCKAAGASAYIPKPVQRGPDFLADLAECVITATAHKSAARVSS
jgi:signal transduction histidine kinase/ActR/RegA family two-component response regulator